MIPRCPTCGRKHKRSTEANRRYWLLLHMIAEKLKPEGQTYSADTWHTYFKQRLIGADEVKLPNGNTHIVVKSSADLDTSEFADYMTQIEEWAASRDVYLEDIS